MGHGKDRDIVRDYLKQFKTRMERLRYTFHNLKNCFSSHTTAGWFSGKTRLHNLSLVGMSE